MKSSINGRAEQFRRMLESPGTLELPGCYDVLSALLLEEAGFQSVFLSGYGVASSQLGYPDIGLTTLSETAAAARHTAAAIRVPLIVDIDNGYGNKEGVVRTIQKIEQAGAAGVQLEDQVFPKRCGHAEGKRVVPLPVFITKLEYALKSRETPLVVIARTDVTELSEAIKRARIFRETGADVVAIDGLSSREDAQRVADSVPGAIQVNLIQGGKTPLLSRDELAGMGFKLVLYSTPALYTAFKIMREEMRRLCESHDLNAVSDASASFKEFQAFIETSYQRRLPPP